MYSDILSEQLQMNINGVIILGVWSILNILIGAVLSFQYKKKPVLRNFFFMNSLWNIGVLIIISGWWWYLSSIPANGQLKEILYTVFTIEKLYLFKAALDLAFVVLGSYLVERGLHHKSSRLQGFGRSFWLQAGFMFLFNIVFYFINAGFNQRYSIFILF